MLLTARQTAFHDLLSAQDPQTLALQEKIDHITRAMRLIATTLAQAQELVNPQGLLFSTVDRLQAPNIASATQDASSAALQPIIDSLPNAHLYHRYLPATVTTFTPFIDVSSPPSSDQINSATKEWFTAAETRFRKALGQTLEAISDASALANFKRNMHSFFQSPNMSDEMRRLHDLVEEFCLARLESVYQSSLTHLVSATSDQWASALDHLSENQVEIDSAAFLFSDLPPPDSSAFDALDSALQKRLDGRSPLLDQCLTCFEVLCDHLRSDLSDWFGPDLLKGKDSEDKLRQGYGTALANALADMKTQFDALMNQGADSRLTSM